MSHAAVEMSHAACVSILVHFTFEAERFVPECFSFVGSVLALYANLEKKTKIRLKNLPLPEISCLLKCRCVFSLILMWFTCVGFVRLCNGTLVGKLSSKFSKCEAFPEMFEPIMTNLLQFESKKVIEQWIFMFVHYFFA